MRSIELKVLIRLKITFGDIGVKFWGRDENTLARPKITFIGISANIDDCYFWLFIRLIFALIDNMSY